MIRPATLVLALGLASVAPAAAQIARVRAAPPDAPKVLITPFQREPGDSTLSVMIPDALRDRIRDAFLTRFNPILKDGMNRALVESGFPTDVPLEHSVVLQLARFLNARLVIEGNINPQAGDTLLIIARLAEAAGATPQSAIASTRLPRDRAGRVTGADLANRLADSYRSFADVQQCRQRLEAHDYAGAMRAATVALGRYASSSNALLCMANVLRGQNAERDTVVKVLQRAASVDSLNTTVLRQLAQYYQDAADTTSLIATLRRILSVDLRDRELRIRTAQLYVRIGGQTGDTAVARQYADSAVEVVDEGLRQSPADLELLTTKSIALAVARRWAQAAEQLETVASADTARVDSLFIFRIVNYYKQIPDSAKLYTWLQRATVRLPQQIAYWIDLSTVAMARNDTAGALNAARQFLQLQPNSGPGHLTVARVLAAQGQVDSARAHAIAAVQADSNMRRFAGGFLVVSGGRALRDSNWTRAAEDLQMAHDWSEPRTPVFATASLYLGVAQLQLAVQADGQANANRNDCDAVRRERDMLTLAEQNVIAGASANRDLANQLLTAAIPGYKQRADAFWRNYRCERAGGGN